MAPLTTSSRLVCYAGGMALLRFTTIRRRNPILLKRTVPARSTASVRFTSGRKIIYQRIILKTESDLTALPGHITKSGTRESSWNH